MRASIVIVSLMFALLGATGIAARAESASFIPKAGFVPDAATAMRIAEAVWIPIYGKKQIESERPFRATLKGNVWHVHGTLGCPHGLVCLGGTAEADIARKDGRIIRVIHGQ